MNNNQLKKNINIIISIIMCLTFLYLIASFIFHIDSPSSEGMSWLAIITSIIAMVYIISSTNHIYGHSLAFIVYLIFTQFGTCIAVYAFKLKTLNTNSYHVTGWINSASYPYAVQLGIIAVIVLSFSVVLSGKYFRAKPYIGGHAESQKSHVIMDRQLIINNMHVLYNIYDINRKVFNQRELYRLSIVFKKLY